jgi:hypothetical protein
VLALDALDAEPLRETRVEPVERLVRDPAAQPRVDLGVDGARIDEALDEPDRGAVAELLELRDREASDLLEMTQDDGVREARRARERREGALESALPAVRLRERSRICFVAQRERRRCAEALPLARRAVEVPDERGQRAPPRPPDHVLSHEARANFLVERARLARAPVVARRLADEREALPGARAGRVEEVALPGDGVGPDEPATAAALLELPAPVVAQERRLR